MRLLHSPSTVVRIKSAEVLGSFGLGAKSAVPELVRLLDDSDQDVQAAAVDALGGLGPAAREAVPRLIARMEIHDGYWMGSPGEALSQIGPDAVPLLVQSMQRRHREPVQFGAAFVLQQLGPRAEAAVPELADMLQAKDFAIRFDAINVLKAIGPSAAAAVPALAIVRKDKNIGAFARDALAHLGESAVPTLAADLPDTVALLGSMGTEAKSALPALEALLGAKHGESIRFAAVEAIAAIGGDTNVILPVIKEMLQASAPQVRVKGIKAMRDAVLRDRTNWMAAALRKSLNDPDRSVRFAAAWALLINFRATAKETIPVLGEMLLDDGSTRIVSREAARDIIMLLGRAEDGEEWTGSKSSHGFSS